MLSYHIKKLSLSAEIIFDEVDDMSESSGTAAMLWSAAKKSWNHFIDLVLQKYSERANGAYAERRY